MVRCDNRENQKKYVGLSVITIIRKGIAIMRERILDKLSNFIYNYMLLSFWGYDKAELFRCKRAITTLSLSEGSYLHNRQFIFIEKSMIICTIWHFISHKLDALLICSDTSAIDLNSIFNPLNELFNKLNISFDIVQVFNSFEIKSISKFCRFLLTILIIFVVHMILLQWLNVTFYNHLYGYAPSTEFQYSKEIIVTNVIYFFIDFSIAIHYFCTSINEALSLFMFMLLLFIDIIFFIIIFIVKQKRKRIITIKVREQKYEIDKEEDKTLDGEKDIFIIKSNSVEPINLFENNLYIVENNDILILGKQTMKLYGKEKICCIVFSNRNGFNKRLYYDKIDGKWTL